MEDSQTIQIDSSHKVKTIYTEEEHAASLNALLDKTAKIVEAKNQEIEELRAKCQKSEEKCIALAIQLESVLERLSTLEKSQTPLKEIEIHIPDVEITTEAESDAEFQVVSRKRKNKGNAREGQKLKKTEGKNETVKMDEEPVRPSTKINSESVSTKDKDYQSTKDRVSTTSTNNINNDKKTDFPALPTTKSPAINNTPPVASTGPQSKIVTRPRRSKIIPPIVITNAGKFVSISKTFRENNINYSSAVVVRNGIKIFPCTVNDHRAASALLDRHKEPFFTFRFPEEKLNHVILRGTPVHLSKEEIINDLSKQGFSPKNIIRWYHANGNPMPLVLVLLPKAEQDIFKVRFVCSFEVSAEPQRTNPRSIQCFNCQDHGHAAPCCHIPPKCVKCGENHHTSQCKKLKEVPPKCANCAGEHAASFSGCPRHPSQIKKNPKPKASTFRGWGTQDNSCLAPTKIPETQPAPVATEAFSSTQMTILSQLLNKQLDTFRTLLSEIRK